MDPEVTVTPHEGPIPNDGVPTYGWRFETLRRRKVRCVICGANRRIVVVAHDADVRSPTLKAICRQCYEAMP